MSIESTLELDDIQSGVLRPRSTPYHATYVIFRIDDRQAGRELIRRLSEVVASAAHPTSPAGEMNGASFFGGSQEKDPIAGASTGDGTFDISKRPIRRRLQGLPRFVVTKGGEYCFLPGLKALRYLAALRDAG